MKSWHEIEEQIRVNGLPYRVERYNMSLRGCLSSTAGPDNGQAKAWTVKEAAAIIRAANADRYAEERTRIGNTPTELLDPKSDEAEALLDSARAAQTAFWDALLELEEALGVEIDANRDLQDVTCADLTDDTEDNDPGRIG